MTDQSQQQPVDSSTTRSRLTESDDIPIGLLCEYQDKVRETFSLWNLRKIISSYNEVKERCIPIQRQFLNCRDEWRRLHQAEGTLNQFCEEFRDELRACIQEISYKRGTHPSAVLDAKQRMENEKEGLDRSKQLIDQTESS